jgi:polyisoprenoid-binding protein YceI
MALVCCILICHGQSSFKGSVSFVSIAPLETIKANSNELTGIIDFNKNSFAFSFKLTSLKGFNSALQKEHFHENYLESTKYPNISYTGKLIDQIDKSQNGTYIIRTKGKFNIHGVERERILKNTVKVLNGKISITSSFDIMLDDYEISIPKIVNKKIAETISVTITATN